MPTPGAKTNSDQLLQRVSTKTVESIWRDALDLLQAELPRASFETWIRDAVPIDFDGNTFIIGIANTYARDWLRDQLGDTIARILAFIIGYAVAVHFVVLNEDMVTEQVILQREQKRVDASTLSPNETQSFTSQIDQRFEITLRFRRYWEEIVFPEKVVSVSRYFVKYWLPILGPHFSSTVLAFKQLRYLHNAQADRPIEVHVADILRWHSITKSTFYRHLEDPHPLLSWFIEETPSINSKYERTEGGKIRQKPNKYIIYAGTPLCPPHQIAIENLLKSLGAGKDPQQTLSALETTLKLPDSDLQVLLERSFETYMENGSNNHPKRSHTVFDIIRRLLGNGQTDMSIERIALLADQLENRLVRPDQSILLTWYFIQQWQPLLKSAAFWLIVYLRSLGYYDKRTSEMRNIFWIDGGYAELGKRVGVSSETISGWLGQNRKSSQTRQSDYMCLFVNELDRGRGRNSEDRRALSIQLKVEMLDPLTPEGEKRFYQLVQNDETSLNSFELLMRIHPEKQDSGQPDSPEKWDTDHLNHPEMWDTIENDYPENRDAGKTHLPEISDAGVLDSTEMWDGFKDTNNTLSIISTKNIMTFTNTTTPNVNQLILPLIYQVEGLRRDEVVGCRLEWSLYELVEGNHLPRAAADKLSRVDRGGTALAAWILYAYSHEGRGIEKPGFFAMSRLLEEPPLLPHEQWVNLAEKGPRFVRECILHVLDPTGEAAKEWGDVMGKVPRERLKALSMALGLSLDP